MDLFYLGNDFYWSTGTKMSSLYSVKDRKRYDWGLVQMELDIGANVNIRPANDEERQWAIEQRKEFVT